MISQAVLSCLDSHQAKYPMLQEQLDKITIYYKEKYGNCISHSV